MATQNSRALRRLAADHGMLHSEPLPQNYFFPLNCDNEDLTQLDILLAGPTHTPFANGVFKLHLTIPTTYPQQPPTAHFRTPIFHPNVDPQTGGVCVETLKRDWDAKLTLRDILVVIGCLLIQPNPDSALNAEAGALIQEDYDSFARRAELMTGIHAVPSRELREAFKEAQNRGDEAMDDTNGREMDCEPVEAATPARRRNQVPEQRGFAATRRLEGSPMTSATRGTTMRARELQPAFPAPIPTSFVVAYEGDDVFGDVISTVEAGMQSQEDDDMVDVNRENDEGCVHKNAQTPPTLATPRRPRGRAVPLGELMLDDTLMRDTSQDSSELEPEYPPSPAKSPSKSLNRSNAKQSTPDRPESSRAAAMRGPNTTPPNLFNKPLAHDSPYVVGTDMTPSPRKAKVSRPMIPATRPVASSNGLLGHRSTQSATALEDVLEPRFRRVQHDAGVVKKKSPSSSEVQVSAAKQAAQLEARLWDMCGRDVSRWNQGDFDGQPFKKKAPRW